MPNYKQHITITLPADVYRCTLCGALAFDKTPGDVHDSCEIRSGEIYVMGGSRGPAGWRGWGRWEGPVGRAEQAVTRPILDDIDLPEGEDSP